MSTASGATWRTLWFRGPSMQQRVKAGAHPDDVSAVRLQANLLAFGRDLRDAGLRIGSGQIISFVEAVAEVYARRQMDFYHAARTTLVNSPEQIPAADARFTMLSRRVMNPMPPVE